MARGQRDAALTAATLETIYARLPRLRCRGLCQASCGPVPMGAAEWARIAAAQAGDGRDVPRTTEVAGGTMPVVGADLTCPLLDRETGRCTVYALRPLLCRLWGLAAGMPCGYGCVPERAVTDQEAHRLLGEVMRLGRS